MTKDKLIIITLLTFFAFGVLFSINISNSKDDELESRIEDVDSRINELEYR